MLRKSWQKLGRALGIVLVAIALLSTVSCTRDNAATTLLARSTNTIAQAGDIAEASPPEAVQTLRRDLEIYQPQVNIVSPEIDEIVEDDKVEVRLQIQNLSIFKDSELELGPHLHVILDNQPYIAVYDLTQPLTLPDLEPGTHTLRVFAARPWHESFKNAGAYAQTTFHIFTKTQNNNPASSLPLLTYSRPKGIYGAEPILLDFYLTNAPLRLTAADDNPVDWRIRCTINGHSFVLDSWQSVYLKGFKPGKNWVKLEFIDSQGNSLENVFNNTVRIITYEPSGKDTLSKLVTGELSANAARGIVDQSYEIKTPILELEPQPVSTETSASPNTKTLMEDIESVKNEKQQSYLSRLRHADSQIAPDLPPLPDNTESPVATPNLDLAPETPVTELD